MKLDTLAAELYDQILQIPLIDPHSHIDPHRAAAKSLDDILGYHYYTELAHSAGMTHAPLSAETPPRERVRAILKHLPRFDNTAQYGWFLEIAREFLGFSGTHVNDKDADALFDAAERAMSQPDWEKRVVKASNLQAVFLTNDFDDPLTGFDTKFYIPCLRTDDLVFKFDQPGVSERLSKATGVEADDVLSLRLAVGKLFDHFVRNNAKACAISLPPDFAPTKVSDADLSRALSNPGDPDAAAIRSRGIFRILAENCAERKLPFDLMIGVNRRVYRGGVFQGQDLFDGRTSLIRYAELFNDFPTVKFPISVLSSGLNQELVSYAWIFPNVLPSGHWWYSNIPTYIEGDLRARLEAVPRTKLVGYYSDMYKLEFALPKFNMYRRILARVLADHFVRTGVVRVSGAVEIARNLLLDNVREIFDV